MKTASRIIGLFVILLGLWWIMQGTGLAPVGFMANQMPWAYRGLGLIVVGGALIFLSRSNPRS